MHKYKFNNYLSRKTFLLIIILIIFIYFISSFYFVFKTDEDVSMGLIQHSFNKLISINSYDVQPPFYYLSLKLFLLLTTFWTKSIFIKTIFARLYSLMFLILFLIYIIKIIRMYKITINYQLQIILFLISPGVINESVKIRMYTMSSFLIVFELYQLLKFLKHTNIMSIILVIISASLTFYIIYPLAISSGLFILIYTIYELYERNIHKSLMLSVSGVVIILTYIPWIPTVLKQIHMHSGVDGSLVYNYFYIMMSSITQINAPSPMSPLLRYTCFISLIVIILFILLISYSFKYLKNKFNNILIITSINLLLTLIISVLICKRQFRLTIIYPIYSIFISLIIVSLIKYLTQTHKKLTYINNIIKILILFVGSVFISYAIVASVVNIKNYDIPSIHLVDTFQLWTTSTKTNINIDKNIHLKRNKPNIIIGSNVNAIQDSIYLKSINKHAYISTNKCAGQDFVAGNVLKNKNYYTWKFYNKMCPYIKYK